VNVSAEGFVTRALSALEASAAQAALHAAMGRPADGHRLAQEVIRREDRRVPLARLSHSCRKPVDPLAPVGAVGAVYRR